MLKVHGEAGFTASLLPPAMLMLISGSLSKLIIQRIKELKESLSKKGNQQNEPTYD